MTAPARGRPSVAVVIPSYNHERFVGAALSSVFGQTLPPDEVLVIDDGSTDRSVDVIERAFADAGSVRCTLSVRGNRGISVTRNELCAAVTTDFVALLDSDDVYAPRRLERLLAGVSPRDPYLAFSGVDFIGDEADARLWEELSQWQFAQGAMLPTAGFALLLSNLVLTNSNVIVSRGLIERVGGFDERLKICQDWDFIARSLRFVEPTFIPEPLVSYRLHADNTSRGAAEHASELDLLADNQCEWMMLPTVNPVAPTPRNWPRLFRVFVGLNQTPAGQALAARLPAAALTAGDGISDREASALRSLVEGGCMPAARQVASRAELMQRCARIWAAGR
ncbi:MAG: glycosyltransferase family 2 protein [Vicinamibacterales bacterium]